MRKTLIALMILQVVLFSFGVCCLIEGDMLSGLFITVINAGSFGLNLFTLRTIRYEEEEKPPSSDAVLVDGWRDARKEMPKHGEYLVYFKRGNEAGFAIALCQGGEWDWVPYDTNVIAWRELPDPPAFA